MYDTVSATSTLTDVLRLDRLARVAARALGVPAAVVGVVQDEMIVFGSTGLCEPFARARTLSRDEPLVAAVLAGAGALPVAGETWRGFQSALGARTPDDGPPGAFVLALDSAARTFNETHRALVGDLAALLEGELRADAGGRRLVAETCRQLEAEDQRKSELMALLAHELRNPLAPILSSLALLRRTGPRGDQLDRIERQAKHLAGLVDRLLDACTLVQGQARLDLEDCRLAQVVERAIAHGRAELDARGHAVEAHVPPALVVRADPVRLQQAFVHLLELGARAMETPGVIAIAARETEHGQVEVTVRDRGTGAPADGIGLTVVRHVVGLHGGRLDARDEEPGRVFVLSFPLAPMPFAPATPHGRASAETPRRRVLVVDDNRDAAETLGELLSLEGHEVALAHDGPSGLARFRELTPEVVLLDIGLPGMDGCQVARAIRGQRGGETTRLIAVTGYGSRADRERTRAAGFDHHLVKPVDVDEVTRLVALPKGGELRSTG
jgi:signal transduction histidine kinase/CheY-like chemotaxis protein